MDNIRNYVYEISFKATNQLNIIQSKYILVSANKKVLQVLNFLHENHSTENTHSSSLVRWGLEVSNSGPLHRLLVRHPKQAA